MPDSPIFAGEAELYLPSIRERYLYYDTPHAPPVPGVPPDADELPQNGGTDAIEPIDH
ncbi:hypothetical protein [Salinispora arenicola]|uniref:hypothetical protein n=1 Tax=Salinispora arenicola TaxID=168697 RepID=UPI00039B56E6|nr:hypothetical protein [Salinispora arenicola]